jgi:hypothetical protein
MSFSRMPTLEAQDGRITCMGFLDELNDKAEELGTRPRKDSKLHRTRRRT